MRILLLNGPNLGTLGRRQPEIYGTTTLSEIVAAARSHAETRGATLLDFQSNHEGALIDRLEQLDYDAIVVNAGALTHYGRSLADALAGSGRPAVEVHISDLAERARREPWRATNVLSPVTRGRVMGRGWQGYLEAIDLVIDGLEGAP